MGEIDTVNELAVDVELQMVRCAIADSYGLRILVACKVVKFDLLKVLRKLSGATVM